MNFAKIGYKAVCFAAVLAFAAACETAPEDSSGSTGQGGAQTSTSTTTMAPKAAEGPMAGSQEDLVLNVGDRVFFDFDKFDLKPEARETIERWADWLNKYPQVTLSVEGHCDERGTREYNLGLGERRATSTRNYLIALGVNPDRIGTISYGKERPVCSSPNDSCWSQNRRGVVVVN